MRNITVHLIGSFDSLFAGRIEDRFFLASTLRSNGIFDHAHIGRHGGRVFREGDPLDRFGLGFVPRRLVSRRIPRRVVLVLVPFRGTFEMGKVRRVVYGTATKTWINQSEYEGNLKKKRKRFTCCRCFPGRERECWSCVRAKRRISLPVSVPLDTWKSLRRATSCNRFPRRLFEKD